MPRLPIRILRKQSYSVFQFLLHTNFDTHETLSYLTPHIAFVFLQSYHISTSSHPHPTSTNEMPDAWDDDWIAKGDSSTAKTEPAPSSTKISKAERRAKQAEFNRQLWEDAEDPKDNFFLKSRDIVPLKSEFKPAMKVLSRKPEKKSAANVEGIGQLNIDDEDDESEDESKKHELTAEERREKAQREREEKQKKYEEVRQKLFGNDQSSSATAATGIKKNSSKNTSPSRNHSNNKSSRDSRPSSSASNRTGRLYDPNDPGKPGGSSVLRKETKVTPDELQPIRSPRAPDNSGRGGVGFAPRGGKLV